MLGGMISNKLPYSIFPWSVDINVLERQNEIYNIEIPKDNSLVKNCPTTVICHVDIGTPHQPLVQLRLREVNHVITDHVTY